MPVLRTHLRQVLGYFRTHDLRYPAVYLFGGSVTRECTINDLSWRKQIVSYGGPRVEAFNLANHSNPLRVSPYYAAGGRRLASYGEAIETLNARQLQLVVQLEY